MKELLPDVVFSEEDLEKIDSLAKEMELTNEVASVLYARGIDTKEKAERFLSAGESHYVSPFKMSGMREAVDLITEARDEDWVVAVYGDYDADGICALTLMREALIEFGIEEPVIFVPERKGGYGLRIEAIDRIFDEYNPQLIITVDCGISCGAEVEYIQEQGAEVIVTDHHELPPSLPDCVTINPKFSDDYPFDNLCGTGVAFKVGVALNGKSFYRFADIAAIATVADSVSLTGENRDMVTEGLRLMNSAPRKSYAGLLKPGETVTSQTISFTLGPKINAAGRMNDARSAYELMSSEDEDEIKRLTEKLTDYNTERQQKCDELYVSAKAMLRQKGAYGSVIMLSGEGWSTGFVGIVAARIADEFSRPTLLFVKEGSSLRGSARSVEGVNIYEALRASSDLIEEFGGHAQAAGINILEENFDKLESSLNEFMGEKYPGGAFAPTLRYDGEICSEKQLSGRIAKELERLEPYGVGNRRPLFVFRAKNCDVKPIKPLSPHFTFNTAGIRSGIKPGDKSDWSGFTYFSGEKNALILESDAEKKIVFEFNIDEFLGRKYIRGLVRDVVYGNEAVFDCKRETEENNLLTLSKPDVEVDETRISDEEADRMLESCENYGTIFIAFDPDTLKKHGKAEQLPTEIFSMTVHNLASMVLVSPRADTDLSGYKNIVLLDGLGRHTLPALEGKKVYSCAARAAMPKVSAKRDDLVKVYRWMLANYDHVTGGSAVEAARTLSPFGRVNLLFAVLVFEELGIVNFETGKMMINAGTKTDLSKSRLYKMMSEAAG
ncbi:MAG: single-stranded-DNA-specific exonuclease RecJ [Clostridia bacterium]|nr:single-stranded-DNA-specific exonuclease RecJ [Clostridia bacterium]